MSAPIVESPRPVTNELELIEEQIKRLETILNAKPLTLAVRGGGVPEDGSGEHSIYFTHMRVVEAREIETTLNRLRGALELERRLRDGTYLLVENHR